MSRTLATLGPLGHAPVAPGTVASLAALPLGYGLHVVGGFPLVAAATVLAFLAGLYAVRAATLETPGEDPKEIVIDELVGQWIALWPLSAGLWFAGASPTLFPWPGWVGAFLLFRAFDILKPGPVGWADRLKSPLGVMLDDVIAGVLAALCVSLLAWIAHGL